MKRTHLMAMLPGIIAVGIFAADANAYYHPGLGRFVSRDHGAEGAMRIGGGGAAPVGQFVPRDQYRDGMNLYQYVRSNPIGHVDPSGLWRDHDVLLKASYDRFWQWRAQQPGAGGNPGNDLSARIYDILETSDLSQDKGQGFKENFRHYNRDMTQTVAAAKQAFKDYMAKEIGWFDYEMNRVRGLSGAARKQSCMNALWSLGRVTHTWQDYYAHAVLANGSPVAWAVGITGSPDQDNNQLVPSSWGDIANPGEHGWSEPGDRDSYSTFTTADGLIPRGCSSCHIGGGLASEELGGGYRVTVVDGVAPRRADAETFVLEKYKRYLHTWYNNCWCSVP